MTGTDAIAELFAGPGARDYLGEAVTIGEQRADRTSRGAPDTFGRTDFEIDDGVPGKGVADLR